MSFYKMLFLWYQTSILFFFILFYFLLQAQPIWQTVGTIQSCNIMIGVYFSPSDLVAAKQIKNSLKQWKSMKTFTEHHI